MLLKLAWRNLWRNTRRTLINLTALILGVTALVSLHSFREVASDVMLDGLTEKIGHLQIHGLGYQDSPEILNVVREPAAVVARAKSVLPEASIEPRVVGAGLAGAGDASTAAMIMGLAPENPGSRTLMEVKKGRLLSAAPSKEAAIGSGIAEELQLEPGGELVLVGQAADGSLANDRFTVVGIVDAGSTDANASAVFLHLADAQSFFSLGDAVHQLVVRLPVHGEEDLSRPVSLVKGALDLQKLEVLSWTELLPELKSALDAKKKNMRLVDVVVFLIVALGVLNTMTMSTFERTREFGVMACLGTRRRRILGMVLFESLLQGLLGFVAGVAISWVLVQAFGTISIGGIAGSDFMGIRMPETFAMGLDPASVISAGLTTLLTVVAGGLLPALRASRLKPIEATRYV